jgi:uncharacterized integral membrane protein
MSSKDASRGAKGRRTGGGRTKSGAGSADGFRKLFTPAGVAALVIGLLTLVFIFENTRQVRIRVLIPEVTMPLYLALLVTWLLGGLCGGYLFRRRVK